MHAERNLKNEIAQNEQAIAELAMLSERHAKALSKALHTNTALLSHDTRSRKL